jgi:hypothetical protein
LGFQGVPKMALVPMRCCTNPEHAPIRHEEGFCKWF